MALMTSDAYPGGAKAVDDHIGDRISDLSRAVSDGFSRTERDSVRIERSLEKLVTQSEFNATVQRLETKDSAIEEKVDVGLASLKEDVNASLKGIRSDMEDGLSRVSGEVTNGFAASAAQTKDRNSKNRWLWGAGITAIGLVNAIVFNVIGIMLK